MFGRKLIKCDARNGTEARQKSLEITAESRLNKLTNKKFVSQFHD